MEIDLRRDKQFQQYQSFLFPFAYNITGDFLASEDIVVEVLNHHILQDNSEIQNPKHYLVKSVVNRAINQKQLLRTKKEQYPGFWLPSPVVTADAIYDAADKEKVLEYSLLVLMEQLTPKERAVFILKETFDLSHEEIGEILDIKTDSSRQLLKRSKEKIQAHDKKSTTLDPSARDLINDLARAILAGDFEQAKTILAGDVQFVSDGGPHVRASRKMLIGPDSVFKMLQAIYGKYAPIGQTTAIAELNHSPAILFFDGGRLFRAVVFNVQKCCIKKVFTIVNPDKVQKIK